jgi:hypothetical protein
MIGPSQRLLPDNTQHSQEKDIHALGGIFFNIFISILQCLLQIMFYKSYFKCIDKEVLVVTRPLGRVDGSYCR